MAKTIVVTVKINRAVMAEMLEWLTRLAMKKTIHKSCWLLTTSGHPICGSIGYGDEENYYSYFVRPLLKPSR